MTLLNMISDSINNPILYHIMIFFYMKETLVILWLIKRKAEGAQS